MPLPADCNILGSANVNFVINQAAKLDLDPEQ